MDKIDRFSLASVPIPVGFESVYENEDGTFITCPIVAATFQTYDLGLRENDDDCLSVFPLLWDISRLEIDEVNTDSPNFVGIKYPGETLEEFLKKVEEETVLL